VTLGQTLRWSLADSVAVALFSIPAPVHRDGPVTTGGRRA
jgi:hypothetical protein